MFTKNSVKVSVIIPVREPDTILINKKLTALMGGGYPSDIQVILVDDNSPVSMMDVADLYFAEYIRLNDSTPWNQAAAKNAGLAVASGEFICATDVDVVFSMENLRKLYDHRDDNDIVVGMVMIPTGLPAAVDSYKEHPLWHERINCFSIIRRECLDKIGGYDERFKGFYGFEDESTRWRLLNIAHAKVKNVPFPAYMTRVDKGSASQDPQIRKDILHGMELFESIIGNNLLLGQLFPPS